MPPARDDAWRRPNRRRRSAPADIVPGENLAHRLDQVSLRHRELRFRLPASRWVEREQWHRDQQSERLEGNEVRIRIPYSDPRELVQDILCYVPHVVVEEPAELRRTVLECLEQGLAAFGADVRKPVARGVVEAALDEIGIERGDEIGVLGRCYAPIIRQRASVPQFLDARRGRRHVADLGIGREMVERLLVDGGQCARQSGGGRGADHRLQGRGVVARCAQIAQALGEKSPASSSSGTMRRTPSSR